MSPTESPEKERKSPLPEEDTPDFLRRREDVENPDPKDNLPAGDTTDPRGAGDLARAEKNAGKDIDTPPKHENQVGKGYSKEADLSKAGASPRGLLRFARQNRGKTILGAGVLSVIIAIIIVGIFFFLPLKILHIVTNLQSHFFATTNNASEKMVDRFFQTYLQKHVLPATTTCGNTINPGCRVIVPAGGNPVTALYRGWSQARFEKKLAEKYGVVFGFNNRTGNYYIDVKGRGQIDISDFKRGETNDLFNSRAMRSNEFRNTYKQAVKVATADETRWKAALIRFKANRLARLKTGLPACIFFCAPRDNVRDWTTDQKNRAYRLARVHRVLAPRDEMTRLVIECLFNRNCDSNLKRGLPPDLDDNGRCRANCIENGKALAGVETSLRSAVLSLQIGGLSGADKLAKAEQLHNDMNSAGSMTRYYATKVVADALQKAGLAQGDAAAKQLAGRLANMVPVIGWLAFLASITATFDYIAENGAQLGYIMNSQTMAAEFQTLVTYADEINEGRADAAMVGSAINALGPCLSSNTCDVGGIAEAEQSPLYGAMLGNREISETTASLGGFFGIASAQGRDGPDYTCGENTDPQPLPEGQLVCPEERLDQTTDAEGLRDGLRQIPGYSVLEASGRAINFVTDKLVGLVCNRLTGPLCDAAAAAITAFINNLPGISQIAEFMGRMFNEFFLPNNPSTLNRSGGRGFNMAAGGADFLGNDVAHHNLGGIWLSQNQANRIAREQKESELADYQYKPLFARLFDTKSRYAPLPRLAMATPVSVNASANSLSSLFSISAVPKIADSLLRILSFGSTSVSAGTNELAEDPFGISQYGYLPSNPIFQEDPERYYQDNCMTNAKTEAWNQAAADYANNSPDSVTKQPENFYDPNDRYQGTNPCLLIWAVAGSAGALFTDEVLSDEELNEPDLSEDGGGGPIDCNSPSGVDQSPGNRGQMGDHADLIISSAQGLTCPEYPKPDGALPGDPGLQYFAYDGCSDNCQDQGENGEEACAGEKKCIKVQYRNPPFQGNSLFLCYEGC